jgi:pimeloyl-ACP methyl ester carboxylesterase
MVNVDRASLHIHCVGEGIPIVVLEAGLGNDGSIWSEVQPEIGLFTRACVSDRAGMGYSTPAHRPHTNRQMAGELHMLLERAGLTGPYVLVGHSMGGMNVRLFASEHADEVAGMVLVDAMTEEESTRYYTLIPNAAMAEFKEGLRKLDEGLDFDTLMAGLADMGSSSRSIGDKPLVVLTRGKEDVRPGTSPEVAAQMLRAWQDMQAQLPRLSSNSAHIVAPNSSHFIQADAPKLVVAAVHEVVQAARTHARVNENALSTIAAEDAR